MAFWTLRMGRKGWKRRTRGVCYHAIPLATCACGCRHAGFGWAGRAVVLHYAVCPASSLLDIILESCILTCYGRVCISCITTVRCFYFHGKVGPPLAQASRTVLLFMNRLSRSNLLLVILIMVLCASQLKCLAACFTRRLHVQHMSNPRAKLRF